MAGHGSRFTEQGYTDSKPFIDVLGKPMVHQVIRNLGILYSEVPYIDPQVITGAGNAQGLENAQVPATSSFGFNISAKF